MKKYPTKSPISGGLVRKTERKEGQIEGDTREGEGEREREGKEREGKGRGRRRGILVIGASVIDCSFQSVMG